MAYTGTWYISDTKSCISLLPVQRSACDELKIEIHCHLYCSFISYFQYFKYKIFSKTVHMTEEGGITTFIFLQLGGGFRFTSVDGSKAAQLTARPASLDI